jgi:CRP-like cAMP-binding protein
LSFAHAGPGSIFGEIATLDGGERTASATAISRVQAMVLPQRAMLDLIENNPKVAVAAIRFLCTRLRDTDQLLEAIALHRIEVRLARLLLSALKLQA